MTETEYYAVRWGTDFINAPYSHDTLMHQPRIGCGHRHRTPQAAKPCGYGKPHVRLYRVDENGWHVYPNPDNDDEMRKETARAEREFAEWCERGCR